MTPPSAERTSDMRIYVYEATEADVPSGRYVARIHHDGAWHPVIFAGVSEGPVRLQAHTWWDEQLAKAEKRHGPKTPKKPTETAPTAEDVGDVL